MYKFSSVSIENAIAIAFEDFKGDHADMAGMTVRDGIALCESATRKFLQSAPEYRDERASSYKFSLVKGSKDNRRSEWSKVEKSKGGLSAADMDSETGLGVKLGWLDEQLAKIEGKLGVLKPELPTKLHEEIVERLWLPALKSRLARREGAQAPAQEAAPAKA